MPKQDVPGDYGAQPKPKQQPQPSSSDPTQRITGDGTTQQQFPDGTIWSWTPDGGGTFQQVTPSGETTTVGPDGNTTTWTPSSNGDGGGSVSTGSGGGGGAGSGKDVPPTPLDWKVYLQDWGFDNDTITGIDKIFRTYDQDHTQDAQAAALAFVRGTPWYAQHFPGIGDGIKKGLFADEVGYRSYVNSIGGITKDALGRDPTTGEIIQDIANGWSPSRVAAGFSASGFLKADKGLVPGGIFSDDELNSISNGQANIGDTNSAGLTNLFSLAQSLNPIYRQHFGRDITRGELNGHFASGMSPDQINKHFTGQEFVNANRNDLQYTLGAFDSTGRATDSELNSFGDQVEGLTNAPGADLQARIQKAQQRLATIVQGTLATPSFSLLGGKKIATSLGRDINSPDIGS